MSAQIGVPTVSGVKGAMFDYGYGLAGGLAYSLITAFTGSGLLGGAVGAALVGAMVKGQKGEMLATILGFQTVVGTANAAASSASSAGSGVM